MHEIHKCIHNQANQCLGLDMQTSCVQMSPNRVGSHKSMLLLSLNALHFVFFCKRLHLQSTCPFSSYILKHLDSMGMQGYYQ